VGAPAADDGDDATMTHQKKMETVNANPKSSWKHSRQNMKRNSYKNSFKNMENIKNIEFQPKRY